MSWADARTEGAAISTEDASSSMARASASVSDTLEPEPPRTPPDVLLPLLTHNTFEPKLSMTP